jgi:xanthine dehydrogenase large subunit
VAEAAEKIRGGVHEALAHDSAARHVSGEARYIDDLPEPAGLLHVCLGLAGRAHARITGLDLEPVCRAPGVVLVLSASDIPGLNDVSPTGTLDDPVFAEGEVMFHGQPLFAVAATTRPAARRAALLARVEYQDLPAKITIEDALEDPELVIPGHRMIRGDALAVLEKAPHRMRGRIEIGGQDHFYLEGQIALALPGEDDEVTIFSSTQHPSEVQHAVAKVLGVLNHAVTVEIRRMGGGFGGKETQGNLFAAVAAMAAKRTGRAAKIRPDRDDDMIATGKRHDFLADYDVGFADDGRVEAVAMRFASRCGFSADLSGAINDRALFHADNAYHYPAALLESLPLRTHTVSNTAFRGFGGPQGMLAAERVIEEIAFALRLDPLDVRKRNLYGPGERALTPYHMAVEDNLLPEVLSDLERTSAYWERREAIRAFNRESPWLKRGLALTPVKFGISFTTSHLNQAGALVHIYTDGSIHLNHGGTEMGQGVYVKVAQVVAETFQVDIDKIRITATTTGKVPNTSATAASSGADLNGKAAEAAARTIKGRLADFAAAAFEVPKEQVVFLPGRVRIGNQEITFKELVQRAYLARVPLSATGFYKTPKIHYDREAARGRPFLYFAYGAAASEVVVDTLTGEYRVTRVDILHDVGKSLNPAIDMGQIEGGFIQGMGWLTTEELVFDDRGRLRTHAPSTYKIPTASDRPADMRIRILEGAANREETIFRSKAVGEPPLMLAISVLHALSDAIASVADHEFCPRLDAPATPERVLTTIERLRERAASAGGAASE